MGNQMKISLMVLCMITFPQITYSQSQDLVTPPSTDSEDPIIISSNKPLRDYTPGIYRVKFWDTDHNQFVPICMDVTGNFLDCNQYLESLGHRVMATEDLNYLLNSGDDSLTILVVPELRGLTYESLSFGARYRESFDMSAMTEDQSRETVTLVVRDLVSSVEENFSVNIDAMRIIPEMPAVVLYDIPKEVVTSLADSQEVKKIKILKLGKKMKPLYYAPHYVYPSYVWGYYNYGDPFWDNPQHRGWKSGKVGILENAVPVSYPDINPPFYPGDTYSEGQSIWDSDRRHATAVASVVTWQDLGLLYHTRPFWVAFNVDQDDPSDYINQLNFLYQKNVDVANVSMLADKDIDDPPSMVELAFDWQTWAHGRPMFVFAAGNDAETEIVQRSWNGIIVGSSRETIQGVYFSWKNPYGYYSDRELPDVVAYPAYQLPYYRPEGESYSTFIGTSFSAPVYSSLAGLIVTMFKMLNYNAPYAELIRSIIYASGEGTCPPSWKWVGFTWTFGYWTDCHFGLGDVVEENILQIVVNSMWDYALIYSAYTDYYSNSFQVDQGESVRAAIAWSQPVTCDSSGENCDNLDGYLVHDFDLYLQEASSPSGPWTTPSPLTRPDRLSVRNDSSWEVIDASNLDPQKYYRLYAPQTLNGTFKPTFLGVAWRVY